MEIFDEEHQWPHQFYFASNVPECKASPATSAYTSVSVVYHACGSSQKKMKIVTITGYAATKHLT